FAAVDPFQVQHLEYDLVPVDLETSRRDAKDGNPAAIVHDVDHVTECGGRAGHLKPDVESLAHALLVHHICEFFARRVNDMADTEPGGNRQDARVDVRDHHLAGADAVRDDGSHDDDRPGAGDQHVLADAIE